MPKREPLKTFIDECAWTWCLFSQLKALSEVPKEDRAIVRRYVDQFVGEMQTVLRHYVILRVCMLVDKPFWKNTKGDVKENLTVDNLIQTLPLPAAVKASLEAKSEVLKKTVKPLLKARNRIVAHLDKENALMNHSLGAMKDGAYEAFFDQLEAIVNDMYAVIYPDPDPKNNPTFFSIKVNMPADPIHEMVVNLRIVQHQLDKAGVVDPRGKGPKKAP